MLVILAALGGWDKHKISRGWRIVLSALALLSIAAFFASNVLYEPDESKAVPVLSNPSSTDEVEQASNIGEVILQYYSLLEQEKYVQAWDLLYKSTTADGVSVWGDKYLTQSQWISGVENFSYVPDVSSLRQLDKSGDRAKFRLVFSYNYTGEAAQIISGTYCLRYNGREWLIEHIEIVRPDRDCW
jgi:hypothetical protein